MQVQDLLRFLTKDARVPLATALTATSALKSANLDSPDALSKTKAAALTLIFPDEKLAKSVVAAAKRVIRKRAADGEIDTVHTPKRVKRDVFQTVDDTPAAELEAGLDIPAATEPHSGLETHIFTTNRAPLLLAFAYVLTGFTLPHLPPSSRWSLAQAVVSEGARKKAQNIGLAGPGAEEEGWASGQPVVRVMSRDVRVLKRWGYIWRERTTDVNAGKANVKDEEVDAREDVDVRGDVDEEPAVWAMDLEKLKKLDGPLTFSAHGSETAHLPVYSPQSARAYILRSFASATLGAEEGEGKKVSLKVAAAERQKNVSRLFQALNILFSSWAGHIPLAELDRKAWSCYVAVRPDVEAGIAGWGAKGQVKLGDVLALKRTPHEKHSAIEPVY